MTVIPTTIPAHTGSVSVSASGKERMTIAATHAQKAPNTLQKIVFVNAAVVPPE